MHITQPYVVVVDSSSSTTSTRSAAAFSMNARIVRVLVNTRPIRQQHRGIYFIPGTPMLVLTGAWYYFFFVGSTVLSSISRWYTIHRHTPTHTVSFFCVPVPLNRMKYLAFESKAVIILFTRTRMIRDCCVL